MEGWMHGVLGAYCLGYLKIFGEVLFPPWARAWRAKEEEGDGFNGWDGRYPVKLHWFVRYMTNQN